MTESETESQDDDDDDVLSSCWCCLYRTDGRCQICVLVAVVHKIFTNLILMIFRLVRE